MPTDPDFDPFFERTPRPARFFAEAHAVIAAHYQRLATVWHARFDTPVPNGPIAESFVEFVPTTLPCAMGRIEVIRPQRIFNEQGELELNRQPEASVQLHFMAFTDNVPYERAEDHSWYEAYGVKKELYAAGSYQVYASPENPPILASRTAALWAEEHYLNSEQAKNEIMHARHIIQILKNHKYPFHELVDTECQALLQAFSEAEPDMELTWEEHL